MEVGSKVRVSLTNPVDHSTTATFKLFSLRTPIITHSSRFVSRVSVAKLVILVADAIYAAQMSRFVRASKYRQDFAHPQPMAGN